MPEKQESKIKIEKEPGKKEGFSVETKETISSTLTEIKERIETGAREKLLTNYEKNKDIPQETKKKITQLKKEKNGDETIFKEIDGWGLLGKEGERNKRKVLVLEAASKIDDINNLSLEAKKLILSDLNFEVDYLNLLHEKTKDPVKKKELKSKINSLKEARKELAGNITGEGPKKIAEDEILEEKKPPEGPRPEGPLPEGKEKEPQPVKVEEETLWVAFRDDEEFLGKWARVTEVSSGTKNATDDFLKKGIDDVKFDFASVWAKKHKTEIKDRTGFEIEKVDKKTLTGIVEAMEGFKELKENPEYAKYNEKIDDLAALRAGWTIEGVRHNVAIGTLNEFHYRKEKLSSQVEGREKELKAARKKLSDLRKGSASYDGMKEIYDKATKDVRDLQTELKSLSSVMEEITTATTGRDLTKEAYNAQMLTMEDMAKNLGTDSGRESYMRGLGLSWEVTPAKQAKQSMFDKIKGKEARIVQEKTTTIYDKDSNEIGVYTDKELEKFLFEKFRDNTTGEFIGAEMKEIATSPEKAKKGIRELYGTMKKDLIRDFVENKLKKEIDPEALERIKELGKRTRIDCKKAIDETLEGTAYTKKDAETIINDTKRVWGVDISRDKFDNYVRDNPLTPEVVKGNISWLVYLIRMIFWISPASKKAK